MLILAVLGAFGIFITPQNTGLVIIIAFVAISVILFSNIYKSLEKTKNDIKEVVKNINLEKRFQTIEKKMTEQQARLSVLEIRK